MYHARVFVIFCDLLVFFYCLLCYGCFLFLWLLWLLRSSCVDVLYFMNMHFYACVMFYPTF